MRKPVQSVLGELADAVRRGRTSAAELTQAALDRIAARDATINAVVSLRAEEAMSEAADVDAGLQAGRTVGRLEPPWESWRLPSFDLGRGGCC
jgi:Asp-tRNA(Asn)/Glu-tRNA(Gln) amidotransferase A subunit family amidase